MSFSYGIALEDKGQDGPKYWGKYPGWIKNNKDPEQRGRVTVICPEVYDKNESDWAEPCFPPGLFCVPPDGTFVWVEFKAGDPHFPIWTGCYYPKGTTPTFAANTPDNLALFTYSASKNGNILIQAQGNTSAQISINPPSSGKVILASGTEGAARVNDPTNGSNITGGSSKVFIG